MSIPTYALAAFKNEILYQMRLHIKYFLFGALSSAIIVLAIGIVYGITGSTNIFPIPLWHLLHLTQNLIPLALLAIGLFMAGFGFKMGLVPFHMWLPDTYRCTHNNWSVTG